MIVDRHTIAQKELLHSDSIAIRNIVVHNSGADAVVTARLEKTAKFITFTPSSFSVAGGDSAVITLTINPAGLIADSAVNLILEEKWSGWTETVPLNLSFDKLHRVETVEPPTNRFELTGNYPNPFNASTVIRFSIPETMPVKLAVYDLNGRLVRMLADNHQTAGSHEMLFQAGDLPSGMYICRLEAGSSIAERKIVLIK